MRKKARTWFLLRALAVALAIMVAAVYVLRWPSGWSSVRVDMPKRQVLALVGPPTVDERGVNGHFWIEQRHMARYELWIAFDRADRVVAFTIDRRIGTAQHFHEERLRGDLSLRSDRTRR